MKRKDRILFLLHDDCFIEFYYLALCESKDMTSCKGLSMKVDNVNKWNYRRKHLIIMCDANVCNI